MANIIASALLRVQADTTQASKALDGLQKQLGGGGGVAGALSNIGQIAAGIGLYKVFEMGAQAVGMFTRRSVEAVEQMQALNIQIHSLAAREMATAMNAAIQSATVWENWGKTTGALTLDVDKLRTSLAGYPGAIALIEERYAGLDVAGKRFQNIQMQINDTIFSAGDTYNTASARADQMINSLRRVAILSPYSTLITNQLFKLGQAFQFSADDSLKMTRGMLNLGAGLGATEPMLERMMFNFAQIRMQGKIMSRDFWELGKAGFDLTGVLKQISADTGIVIKDHLDFNAAIKNGKISWEQFATSFEKYATLNFGGAAERMAYSIQGLKSTFSDVFNLLVPDVLMPFADAVGVWAKGVVEKILSIAESGELKRIGNDIYGIFDNLLNMLGGDLPDRVETVMDETGDKFGGEQILGNQYSNTILGRVRKFLDDLKRNFEYFEINPNAGIMLFLNRLGIAADPAVADALLGLKDAIGPLLDKITQYGEDLFKPITDFFQGLIDKAGGFSITAEAINGITTAITNFGLFLDSDAGQRILKFLQGAGLVILVAVGFMALAGAVLSVLAAIAGLFNPVVLIVGFFAILVGALFAIDEQIRAIPEVWAGIWNNVCIIVGTLIGYLIVMVAAGFAGVLRVVVNVGTAIYTTIVMGWISIINYMTGLITRFRTIGSSIINGLLAGLKDAWGAVSKWLIERAKWVEDIWRKITRTNSPSAAMYDVGVDLMAGLNKGMMQSIRGPASSLASLTSSGPINPDPYGGTGNLNSYTTPPGGMKTYGWTPSGYGGGGSTAAITSAVTAAVESVAEVIAATLPAVTAAAAESAATVSTSSMNQMLMDSAQATADMRREQDRQNALLQIKLDELIAAVRSGATDRGVATSVAEAMQFTDFG